MAGAANRTEKIDSAVEIGILFDLYGPLLSERQQECVRLYYDENCSLTEIADAAGITKQAVSDALRKAEKSLRGYEEKLGLAARWKKENGI